MVSRSLALCVLAALCVPPPIGWAEPAPAIELRVATMMPARGMLKVKKWARDVAQATGGKLRIKATRRSRFGDESDILARLRDGDVGAAHLSSAAIREFVRQAMILDAPGLFSSQRQVVAARKAMAAEFDKEAWINGYRVIGWADVVPTRIFSKQPVRAPKDLRRMRPWQPEGPIMKELYAVVGARGVPLKVRDVFMGLRTDTVNVVYASAVSAMSLMWHTQTKYVSRQTGGYIQIALVIRRDRFEALGPELAGPLVKLTERFNRQVAKTLRQDDKKVYKRLLQRGLTSVDIDVDSWVKVGIDLRERFVGRLYTNEMLDKAKRIARETY